MIDEEERTETEENETERKTVEREKKGIFRLGLGGDKVKCTRCGVEEVLPNGLCKSLLPNGLCKSCDDNEVIEIKIYFKRRLLVISDLRKEQIRVYTNLDVS